LTRLYPFYSGCGTFANKSLIHKIAGESSENVWCCVSGGEILARLDDYVGRSAFYVGDLDRKITWICAQIVKSGDTVLDIGANIGLVTLWLARLVGKNGKVHAFEPNPELQNTLEKVLERNRLSNVRLHQIALGSEQAELELRIPRFNAGGASLVRNKTLVDCAVHYVPVRCLSDIVAEEKIKSIRLMKIDVEGFEMEVMRGATEALRVIRPEAVLFESNERLKGPVSEQPVIKLLREFGYGFFSIPKCLLRMRLQRLDPDSSSELAGHDLMAAREGECYERIANSVRAS